MHRVALSLGLIAASASAAAALTEFEASSAASTNNKSSLRVRRAIVGAAAAANGANGALTSQRQDAINLLRQKGKATLREGPDGAGSADAMQGKKPKRGEKKVLNYKRGLQTHQVEAADAMTLEDEEYWDRYLTEETSIVPTPGPTPNPTPRPTPGLTPPPTPGPTPPTTPGPTPAPTPRPTTAVPSTSAPTFTCNLSAEDRAAAIANILSRVSKPITFVPPFSPQSRSLKWIT